MKNKKINKIGSALVLALIFVLAGCTNKADNQDVRTQESRTEAHRQKSLARDASIQGEVSEYGELVSKAQDLTNAKRYDESNGMLNQMAIAKLNTAAFAAVKESANQIRQQNTDGVVTQAKEQAAAQKKAKPKQVIKKLSTVQKDAFVDWAVEQAKASGMAVSKRYFDYAKNGKGDWYAKTVNGRIQVKNNNLPGKAKFPLHALFGLVFYYAKDGTVGYDSKTDAYTMANDYRNTRQRKKVYKYILADDGQVYVWSNKAGGYAGDGFAELNKRGRVGGNIPAGTWSVAPKPETQAEYRKIIAMK
ncbi:hypothetical protein EQG49_05765 [Periweissella cryptocerci]|uniref:Lipoprotein n=1 Tax=Periweissella cryptocerci TaxID=2506420 RepID=A0A4P6YTI5_9LACO|nr:hypothetical protein [Periweissella cryptocerci]QBO36001.1 hypothetical protein EQG49_05765 [Periweissella cryptocerci]